MYTIKVDGRVYERSKTKERKDEIVTILKSMYPKSKITVTAGASLNK